jgi:glucose/arabinose dehydrogenase
MHRHLLLLMVLLLAACNGTDSPPPPTPTPDTGSPTFTSPTTAPSSTSVPTTIPETDTPLPSSSPSPDATTFPDPGNYTWQLIVSGLDRPVDLQADGSGRLFVVEKYGHIHVIEDGQMVDAPFLNIEDRVNNNSNEMGLLGLAFHPDYAQNGYFFVNYTGSGGDTFISRFQVTSNPYQAEPASEVNLLRLNQPFPNHNGGGLDFGPDGYLYAGLGDGGAAGDPFGNGQKTDTLLGKVLRLDVNSSEPYAVPTDNPFGNEIWDYGLRNPWRISFDSSNGDLYIGDVGQGAWEEIDIHPAGTPGGINYGWDFREGAHEYEGNAPSGLTDPIAEYSHDVGGCSITGGYVYRGSSMPEWNGIYFYGDYCTGYVWGLINSDGGWQNQLLFQTGMRITSFGQDETGEVYLVIDSGDVYKLVIQ